MIKEEDAIDYAKILLTVRYPDKNGCGCYVWELISEDHRQDLILEAKKLINAGYGKKKNENLRN